uniref:H15 domain-containing protein n=1 Tax=Pelusios castaneus TaxID=367368 RepID=A0A8C8VFD6_9SAUR
MNEEQPVRASEAPLPASQKRRKKKKEKPPRKPRPAFAQLILWSVDFSKSRKGFSLVAIEKELAATGVDVHRNKSRIKAALKRLVTNNILCKVPGAAGTPGTYKLSKGPGVGKTQLVLQLPNTQAAKKPAKQKRRRAKKRPVPQKAEKKSKEKGAKGPGKKKKMRKGADKIFSAGGVASPPRES